ncbi:MAG: cysteine synthase family protein [Ignisphaera sp.]|nr:cysteine synthase family protein [Ignisphaera sp.]MCX8167683.1 cysteine synthase family protein [Ignisphaera sp.]MDW8085673.1 cysteine synthase family protein [Ignisphaera sp.]
MRGIEDIIGGTPLIKLQRIRSSSGAEIHIKLEFLNPTGSHKDRIALYMIKDAIRKYGLKPGDVVVEASSGNTAISVASIARRFGLRPLIVIPRGTSRNKVVVLRMLGAEIIEGSDNPSSKEYYIGLAERIAREHGWVFLNQYANPVNVLAHYETTAVEIWNALNGAIDAFVMGVGTGGTITGVGKFLKERKKDVLIAAVTPKGSPLAGGSIGNRIEGLLYTDIPPLLDRAIVDRIIEVSYEEAIDMCIKLAKEEGILAGVSSGANVAGALKISSEVKQGNIVTVIADSAFRYIDEIARESDLGLP